MASMTPSRARRLAALVIVVALAISAFWLSRLLHAKGLAWAANVSNVVSVVLAFIALLMPLFWPTHNLVARPQAGIEISNYRLQK